MREAVASSAAHQVDNAALAAGKHCRRGHATGVEGATQIDLDILPPDIGIAFPYWTEGSEGAVIVDEQVNRAEVGRNPTERILDTEAIDKIDSDGDCCPAFPVDEGRSLVYLACRWRQDGDLGAALRLMKRDLAPDPASCAGDDSL